jgi:hypothetical protein
VVTPRVIHDEPESDIVPFIPCGNDNLLDRVIIVINQAPGISDHLKGMLQSMAGQTKVKQASETQSATRCIPHTNGMDATSKQQQKNQKITSTREGNPSRKATN